MKTLPESACSSGMKSVPEESVLEGGTRNLRYTNPGSRPSYAALGDVLLLPNSPRVSPSRDKISTYKFATGVSF